MKVAHIAGVSKTAYVPTTTRCSVLRAWPTASAYVQKLAVPDRVCKERVATARCLAR